MQFRQWLKGHPMIAACLAVGAVLLNWLPQWVASVWSLFSSEPMFKWLGNHHMPRLTFSPSYITAPITIGLLVIILWGLFSPVRKSKLSSKRVATSHEIRFDYLPKNMLECGWRQAYPADAVKPEAIVEQDAPIQGSVTITAPEGHAYDYRLPQNAVLSNRIVFTAKYLTEDTMIFVRLNLRSQDGKEQRQKWVKIKVGAHEGSYPTPKWEDHECTLVVKATPLDGWQHIDLFLPDVVLKTWGKRGLIFEGITTFRVRASLQISPICLYQEFTLPS
jgi:hypothetical protein